LLQRQSSSSGRTAVLFYFPTNACITRSVAFELPVGEIHYSISTW